MSADKFRSKAEALRQRLRVLSSYVKMLTPTGTKSGDADRRRFHQFVESELTEIGSLYEHLIEGAEFKANRTTLQRLLDWILRINIKFQKQQSMTIKIDAKAVRSGRRITGDSSDSHGDHSPDCE
jgi:hypothetical protein